MITCFIHSKKFNTKNKLWGKKNNQSPAKKNLFSKKLIFAFWLFLNLYPLTWATNHPVKGSTLSPKTLSKIVDNKNITDAKTALQNYYLQLGFSYVQVLQLNEEILVYEYPVKKIQCDFKEFCNHFFSGIWLSYPLDVFELEEVMHHTSHSLAFTKLYKNLKALPQINKNKNETILLVQAEKKTQLKAYWEGGNYLHYGVYSKADLAIQYSSFSTGIFAFGGFMPKRKAFALALSFFDLHFVKKSPWVFSVKSGFFHWQEKTQSTLQEKNISIDLRTKIKWVTSYPVFFMLRSSFRDRVNIYTQIPKPQKRHIENQNLFVSSVFYISSENKPLTTEKTKLEITHSTMHNPIFIFKLNIHEVFKIPWVNNVYGRMAFTYLHSPRLWREAIETWSFSYYSVFVPKVYRYLLGVENEFFTGRIGIYTEGVQLFGSSVGAYFGLMVLNLSVRLTSGYLFHKKDSEWFLQLRTKGVF